jgi:hypothetical protein
MLTTPAGCRSSSTDRSGSRQRRRSGSTALRRLRPQAGKIAACTSGARSGSGPVIVPAPCSLRADAGRQGRPSDRWHRNSSHRYLPWWWRASAHRRCCKFGAVHLVRARRMMCRFPALPGRRVSSLRCGPRRTLGDIDSFRSNRGVQHHVDSSTANHLVTTKQALTQVACPLRYTDRGGIPRLDVELDAP